ncbi:hypothetical protein SAMN02746073_1087 [Legionella jamestowniensis DSM 19215]|nr:hypothetical protein SAMN02746073_1087 [Legionella jamestowniensis DSM 19215]
MRVLVHKSLAVGLVEIIPPNNEKTPARSEVYAIFSLLLGRVIDAIQ